MKSVIAVALLAVLVNGSAALAQATPDAPPSPVTPPAVGVPAAPVPRIDDSAKQANGNTNDKSQEVQPKQEPQK